MSFLPKPNKSKSNKLIPNLLQKPCNASTGEDLNSLNSVWSSLSSILQACPKGSQLTEDERHIRRGRASLQQWCCPSSQEVLVGDWSLGRLPTVPHSGFNFWVVKAAANTSNYLQKKPSHLGSQSLHLPS